MTKRRADESSIEDSSEQSERLFSDEMVDRLKSAPIWRADSNPAKINAFPKRAIRQSKRKAKENVKLSVSSPD